VAQTRERRRYESPLRAEQAARTRAAVLDAAGRLFAANGWAGTGVRDVARAAGVAVETVYTAFGSKTDLLLAAIDVAVVGDLDPVALGDRPEFAALGRGPRAARARAAAHLVRDINERLAGIGKAFREAAVGDATLAQRLVEAEDRRRVSVGQAADLVAGRPVTDTERDGLWAVVSLEVHDLLVQRTGWSGDAYESWLADAIERLLRPGKGRP
jgi:AcrR family transcriptional regulator